MTSRFILIVFVDPTESRLLSWLRPGFRHCFCARHDGQRWIVCDSLKHRIELQVLDLPPGFDLAGFYRGQGHRVLTVHIEPAPRSPSLVPEPLTCVGVTKRILGLRAPSALTPWQLYRHLLFGRHRTSLRCFAEHHEPRPIEGGEID